MKTYTFKLPKKHDAAKAYKDALIERTITAYPWLTIDSKFDYPKSNYGIEYAKENDYITLGVSKKHNISWLPAACATCPFKCFDNDTVNFDLETEFFKAINALDLYAKANCPFKDYDFEDEFGTPIRIFDNFIQIGYEVIPIVPGSLNYLKPNTKKLVINITINLKKRGLF